MPITPVAVPPDSAQQPHLNEEQFARLLDRLIAATPPALSDYLTEPQFAKLVHRSLRQIRRWDELRIGPPRINFQNVRLYRRSAVEQWLLRHENGPIEPRKGRR
jgi:hypothetical protein